MRQAFDFEITHACFIFESVNSRSKLGIIPDRQRIKRNMRRSIADPCQETRLKKSCHRVLFIKNLATRYGSFKLTLILVDH